MGAGRGAIDRHVVPRWRNVRDTVAAGEFQRLAHARDLADAHRQELDQLEERWLIVGTELAAAELVGARLVAGQKGKATEPAKRLLQSGNEAYRRLGERVIHDGRSPHVRAVPATIPSLESLVYDKIRQAKRRIAGDPRNPIAWSDLARRYTGIGQFKRAADSLEIARLLAPDSRYLLRVNARFLLQTGDSSAAAHLLRSSPRTLEDPWLLAALMATSTMARERLPGRRVAQRILDRGRYRAIETAELLSELGTLEFSAGADKRAKALVLQSVEAPTDNSLAQALWVAQKHPSLEVDVNDVDVAFPAEAKAWDATHRGAWDVALEQSAEWLADQPFDADAAAHASYVAAVGLDQWKDSVRFAEIGLRANPNDATLSNNRAYALIEMGELDEAERALRKAVENMSDRSDRVAIVATGGLHQFRCGNAEAGRSLYRQAIDLARRLRDPHAEATARAMLIREEAQVGLVDPRELAALDKVANGITSAGVLRCVRRAHELAEVPDSTR